MAEIDELRKDFKELNDAYDRHMRYHEDTDKQQDTITEIIIDIVKWVGIPDSIQIAVLKNRISKLEGEP